LAARDRWHELASAIQNSNLPASDKSVFRFLLDRANYGTAEMLDRFTPSQASIARQTSHSLRQVKYAIDHLRRHGWIKTEGATGPGRKLSYTLASGAGCDCTGRVHESERVQPETVTGATFGHRSGATNGCNAAAQSVVSTERQREGRVGRKPERDLALCAVCETAMDPVLPAAGFTTHPCCDPDEVSLLWPPLEEPPKGLTTHGHQLVERDR
jgi:hypothetical protein